MNIGSTQCGHLIPVGTRINVKGLRQTRDAMSCRVSIILKCASKNPSLLALSLPTVAAAALPVPCSRAAAAASCHSPRTPLSGTFLSKCPCSRNGLQAHSRASQYSESCRRLVSPHAHPPIATTVRCMTRNQATADLLGEFQRDVSVRLSGLIEKQRSVRRGLLDHLRVRVVPVLPAYRI